MARAGSVEVDIRANSAQFVREMRRVSRSTKRVEGQLKSFARVARASLGVFGIAGAASLGRNVLQTANTLDDFSRRLGVSGEQLQAWQQVALQSGVNTQTFNLALQRLNRRAAEAAQGTGEAQAALRELGIDAQAFTELSLDDQMFDLAQALAGVAGDTDKLRIAFKLFDSEGTALLQTLKLTEDELRSLRAEVNTWDEETRQALAAANTEIELWAANITIFFGNLMSGIRDIFTAGNNMANRVRAQRGRTATPLAGAAATGGVLQGPPEPPRATSIGGAVPTRFSQLFPDSGGFQSAASVRAAAQFAELDRLRGVGGAGGFQSEADVQFAAAIEKYEAGLRRVRESQEQFTDLFTDNLVQAADGSFNAILESWKNTLVQMAAATLASQFWQLLAGTGVGGRITSFLGGSGFGGADPLRD